MLEILRGSRVEDVICDHHRPFLDQSPVLQQLQVRAILLLVVVNEQEVNLFQSLQFFLIGGYLPDDIVHLQPSMGCHFLGDGCELPADLDSVELPLSLHRSSDQSPRVSTIPTQLNQNLGFVSLNHISQHLSLVLPDIHQEVFKGECVKVLQNTFRVLLSVSQYEL